jgi:hypothetical protein
MQKKGIEEVPNISNYYLPKKFISETNDLNNCSCWVCTELKDKKKIIQRQNFCLPVIIGFEQ